MNTIYYRNTAEPTSVPSYCVSVERSLDVMKSSPTYKWNHVNKQERC